MNKLQREKALDTGLETLQTSDGSLKTQVYEGFVEELDPDYKNNGLLKVRVPILHLDRPLERIPYSRLTAYLRASCLEWDDPKWVWWEGEIHIHKQTLANVSTPEPLTLEETSLTGPASLGIASGTLSLGEGSGSTKLSGKMNIAVDVPNDEDPIGSMRAKITPDPYNITPWHKIREGPGLIRIGDRVLVQVVNGNENYLVVTELIL